MTTNRKEKYASTDALPPENGFSLISTEKLLQLYSTMVKIRMLERRARPLFPSSQSYANGNTTRSQEAAAVGVAVDLLPKDVIVRCPGGFVLDFVKGVPLGRLLPRLGADGGRGNSRTSYAQLARAIQTAVGNTMKRGAVAVVFRTGGFTEEESWQRALQLAGKLKLPVIFVCWKGFMAGTESEKRTMGRKDAVWPAPAFGFPGITVDGNDVVAVYRVATEAIAHARRGNGPTLIACESWPDNDCSMYDKELSSALWQARRSQSCDPILVMEEYLTDKGLFKQKYRREAAAAFGREWDAAMQSSGRARPSAARRGLAMR